MLVAAVVLVAVLSLWLALAESHDADSLGTEPPRSGPVKQTNRPPGVARRPSEVSVPVGEPHEEVGTVEVVAPERFAGAPLHLQPEAVYDLVEEARRVCHDDEADVILVVDCEEYPCIAMTLSRNGVVDPFCAEVAAPRFPPTWEVRSPINIQEGRYTLGHPLVLEEDLADKDLERRIQERSVEMALDWLERR